MLLQLVAACTFLGSHLVVASLRCQNANGNDVDYWTGVKFPRPMGTRYAYTDSGLDQSQWSLGQDLTATTANPLSSTLASLYEIASYGYIMWNDEIAASSGGSTSSTKAHAKGVLGLGPEGGFWLVHSVPKFPDRPAVSDYTGIASGQQINAQSFLCLSLDPSTIEQVSGLLGFEDLNIYSTTADLPDSIARQYTITAGLVGKKPSGAARTSNLAIQTEAGEPFVAFATSSTDIGGGSKTPQYLYEDLVTSYFSSSLDVSTWPDEAGYQASDCPTSGYITQNVQGVSVKEAGVGWRTTTDHSKWCITSRHKAADQQQVQVACVGDKNRADKQLIRGGGTVCFAANSNVWRLYSSLIDLVESCSS